MPSQQPPCCICRFVPNFVHPTFLFLAAAAGSGLTRALETRWHPQPPGAERPPADRSTDTEQACRRICAVRSRRSRLPPDWPPPRCRLSEGDSRCARDAGVTPARTARKLAAEGANKPRQRPLRAGSTGARFRPVAPSNGKAPWRYSGPVRLSNAPPGRPQPTERVANAPTCRESGRRRRCGGYRGPSCPGLVARSVPILPELGERAPSPFNSFLYNAWRDDSDREARTRSRRDCSINGTPRAPWTRIPLPIQEL